MLLVVDWDAAVGCRLECCYGWYTGVLLWVVDWNADAVG